MSKRRNQNHARTKSRSVATQVDHAVATTDAVTDVKDSTLTIQELAYFKAEKRGFQPGFELQDWLEAEQE